MIGRALWIALLLATLFAPASDGREPWTVLKNCEYLPNPSNDGDSFHVRADGKEYIFRLYFVDAPETDSSLGERLAVQAKYFGVTVPQVRDVGKEATKFTREQMAKPFVVRTCKQDAMGRSKLERFYAFVECDGLDLGEQLVANGLARVFGTHANMSGGKTATLAELTRLKVLESDARSQKIGGWGVANGRMGTRSVPLKQREENAFDAFFHPERLKRNSPSPTPSPTPSPSAMPTADEQPAPAKKKDGKLDPNTATVAELDALPGIGPVLAQRIIDARPFKNADELRRVKGIGPKKFATIRPFFSGAE